MYGKLMLAGGLLLVTAQAGVAQPSPQPVWPADLKAAVQGKWYAERNLEEVEVVGTDVILRKHAQFNTLYSNLPIGFVVARLGDVDTSRGGPFVKIMKGQCADASTNNQMNPCLIMINMSQPISGGPFHIALTVRERYWLDGGLTKDGRAYRARAPGS